MPVVHYKITVKLLRGKVVNATGSIRDIPQDQTLNRQIDPLNLTIFFRAELGKYVGYQRRVEQKPLRKLQTDFIGLNDGGF